MTMVVDEFIEVLAGTLFYTIHYLFKGYLHRYSNTASSHPLIVYHSPYYSYKK